MSFALRTEMSLLESHYYRTNKKLLTIVGLWPYQTAKLRRSQFVLGTAIMISGIIVQISLDLSMSEQLREMCLNNFQCNTFFTMAYDMDEILNVFSWCATILSYIMKYSVIASNVQTIGLLVEHIRTDWALLKNETEINIIRKYSAIGRYLTLGFTPTFHKHKDFSFSYRIKTAFDSSRSDFFPSRDVIVYGELVDAVTIHNRNIEFTIIVRSIFVKSYLFLLPFGMASMTINLYLVSCIESMKEFQRQAQLVWFTFGQVLYVFSCNYCAQILGDTSFSVFEKAYDTEWYCAPIRSQKLLLFTLQRSMKKITWVVCGLFTPCLEGFVTV
ncbi:hypothetical protein KM043_002523 [Ampulex compressa]|nr:hypothetical protein KM043_002523 [Ampulex compressa]